MPCVPTRNKNNFIVFGSPAIESDEIASVTECMKSGWLGTGPKVAVFEEAFRTYKRAEFAVAVNSCTAALHLSLIAAKIEPGNEVITTAMTFCSTVNAIVHAGAIPVIVDIDPKTKNIDVDQIERHITPKTKAIVPVHYAGYPCEMDRISELSCKYGLKVIEDCAHAIEAEYNGRPVGTLGDFGCFSFYVTKNIVTGEGGMVLTRREDDASRIKRLALHGMSKDAWKRFSDDGYKHYHVVECGFKYNMMDIQAAIGIEQLKRIDQYWQRRKEIYDEYQAAFKGLPISIPELDKRNVRHSYHLYPICVEKQRTGISRDNFLNAMTKENIGVGVHYLSIPEHPYYQKKFGWKTQDYPIAKEYGRNTVSLPLSAKLTNDDVADVIAAVKKTVASAI